jgi:hypothetical protein
MKKLLVLLISLIFTVHADESLEVKNFKISGLVGNLTDSKSIAFELGAEKALEIVMMRLKTDNSKDSKDLVDCLNRIEKKSDLIEKFTIKSERMTSKSYSALVDFTFKKEITSLLNKCGIAYGSFWGGQTLLLPLMIDEKNQVEVVDEKNNYPLYQALAKSDKNFGVLEIIQVIDKNLIENYGIDLDSLVAGDSLNTKELAHQLKGETLIMILFQKTGSTEPKVAVKITTQNKFYNNTLERVALEKEEDYSALIAKILRDSDMLLKKGLKSDKAPLFNSLVLFQLKSSDDWQKLRLILNKIPEIKEYRFKTISNDRIELEMKYSMSPSQLSNEFLKEGVSLFKINNQTMMKLK